MPAERNAFRLGLTAIIMLGLLFGAILFVGGTRFESREEIVVWVAHDQKLPRLKAGAPIICGPQQVGSVTGVTMVEAPSPDDPSIEDFLFFEIRGEVNASLDLREDCSIVVEGPLLGENGQLTIESRGVSSRRASAEVPIHARASGFATDWEMITGEFDEDNPKSLLAQIKSQLDPAASRSMMAKVHRSLNDLNAMSANLAQSVDPTRRDAIISKIDVILDHLNEAMAALRNELASKEGEALLAKAHRGLDLLDRGLLAVVEVVEENRAGIADTVEHLEHAAIVLDEDIIGAAADEFDRKRAESLLSRLHELFNQLDGALTDIGLAAAKTRSVATLGHDRLVALIDNAKEASAQLKGLTKELRRQPWRLLHKPTAKESKQAAILMRRASLPWRLSIWTTR